MNSTLYVIFPKMCAVTVSILFGQLFIHETKGFQFSNNFIKLRGSCKLGPKVLVLDIHVHASACVLFMFVVYIRICVKGVTNIQTQL